MRVIIDNKMTFFAQAPILNIGFLFYFYLLIITEPNIYKLKSGLKIQKEMNW